VRELKNIMERTLILQHGPELRPSEFLRGSLAITSTYSVAGGNGVTPLEKVEKDYIRQALDTYSGNYTRTARALGISLSTLKRKVTRYGPVSP